MDAVWNLNTIVDRNLNSSSRATKTDFLWMVGMNKQATNSQANKHANMQTRKHANKQTTIAHVWQFDTITSWNTYKEDSNPRWVVSYRWLWPCLCFSCFVNLAKRCHFCDRLQISFPTAQKSKNKSNTLGHEEETKLDTLPISWCISETYSTAMKWAIVLWIHWTGGWDCQTKWLRSSCVLSR